MATIRFAVLVQELSKGKGQAGRLTVKHIYQHQADADQCARAYYDVLSCPAEVAEMTPPLAVVRRADAWGVLDRAGKSLSLFESSETAQAHAAETGTIFIDVPLRKAMPVQHGVPQFAPSGGKTS